MALRHRPADEAVPRPQVEDVELVDPGRHDQQRPLQHLLGASARTGSAASGRSGYTTLPGETPMFSPTLKASMSVILMLQLALAPLQVAQQVVQALQQVLAAGLGGLAQHLGIGQQEVATGSSHRRTAARRNPPSAPSSGPARRPASTTSCTKRARQQVGLLDEVEDLVLLPGVVLEAAVGRRPRRSPARPPCPSCAARCSARASCSPARSRAGPAISRAGLAISRAVISMNALADVQRIGRVLLVRLALQPLADDALGAFGDVGHRATDLRRVGQLEPGGFGLRRSRPYASFPSAPPQATSGRQAWSGFDDADQRKWRAT